MGSNTERAQLTNSTGTIPNLNIRGTGAATSKRNTNTLAIGTGEDEPGGESKAEEANKENDEAAAASKKAVNGNKYGDAKRNTRNREEELRRMKRRALVGRYRGGYLAPSPPGHGTRIYRRSGLGLR